MSLMKLAEADRSSAVNTYGTLSQLEQQRENANNQLDANHSAQQASMAGGAVGSGLAAGAMFGGPIGVGVGLGMLALGSLF